MIFSEKLQHLRKENHLSQEELATRLNVSRQAISKWESGATPDIDNIVKISRYFDCSLDYLMNNEITQLNIPKNDIKPSTSGFASKKKCQN